MTLAEAPGGTTRVPQWCAVRPLQPPIGCGAPHPSPWWRVKGSHCPPPAKVVLWGAPRRGLITVVERAAPTAVIEKGPAHTLVLLGQSGALS